MIQALMQRSVIYQSANGVNSLSACFDWSRRVRGEMFVVLLSDVGSN
jgi:hypothetical protein